jgi:DNA-binding winged helix-turn-helix (wHTH) protein
MLISMTVPEALRGDCMVNGNRVHLTPTEHRLVSLLLLTPPGHVVETYDIIEHVWPNPDTQPETATKIISVLKYKLKSAKGIDVKTCWGRGLYAFSAESRGGRPKVPHGQLILVQRGTGRNHQGFEWIGADIPEWRRVA